MVAKLGSISTGVTSTLKNDAMDATKKVNDQLTKDTQDMDDEVAKLADTQILYKTIGEAVFNFFSSDRREINFKAGMLIVDADDEVLIEDLAYHVKQKRIKVEGE